MQRGSVSAASLWGLPQWSPDPNCHTSLEQLTSQSGSRGDLPLIPLKEVGDLVRPLGEEDPGRAPWPITRVTNVVVSWSLYYAVPPRWARFCPS